MAVAMSRVCGSLNLPTEGSWASLPRESHVELALPLLPRRTSSAGRFQWGAAFNK